MTRSTRHPLLGINLPELLVALAVLGILLAVAIPSLSEFVRKKRLEAVAEEVRADFSLAKATSATVDQMGRGVWHQVHDSQACYTMFISTPAFISCDCTRPIGKTCGTVADRELKVMRVPGASGITLRASHPAAFFRQGFRVVPTSTAIGIVGGEIPPYSVTVQDAGGRSLQVRVSSVGQMQICAPAGNFSGYPAC